LPTGLASPATNSFWRGALLAEVTSDLLAVRLQAGRGFEILATAGPVDEVSEWGERPADSLEGIASAVDSSKSLPLAQGLVQDMATASEVQVNASEKLVEQLKKITEAALAKGAVRITEADAADAPALKGGKWSLMQEMNVREAAQQLREEYSVRRRILLNRLDCTVQSMSVNEKAMVPSGRRKVADILSRMWAGWRRNMSEAPPLSEWSALAVTRGVIFRAVTARVAGPGSKLTSNVKKVLIGDVPDRGGIPDGYGKNRKEGGAAAPAAALPSGGGGGPAAKKQRTGSSITTVSEGDKTGQAESAASLAAFFESAAAGDAAAAAASSTSSSSAAAAAPAEGGGGEGAGAEKTTAVAEKRPEKGNTVTGARSVNKELMQQAKADQKKEREEGKEKTYYEELREVRDY